MKKLMLSALLVLLCAALAAEETKDDGFVSLYNGKDLTGWHAYAGNLSSWQADGELIKCIKGGGGWLSPDKEYADFVLKVDWRIEKDGNSGIGLRFPAKGGVSQEGMEIQILDDDAPMHKNLKAAQYTGSIRSRPGNEPPSRSANGTPTKLPAKGRWWS